jgi:peroxiredoxin
MTPALGTDTPAFDLPGVDGRNHTLDDYADAEALALVQSCNHCPYVLAWEGRLIELQERYRDRGVRFAAFNSNDASRYPADSFEAMVEHAADVGLTFDYLHDPEQSLARALGSERTPEAFVFDRDRRLVYHGAIDDNRDETAVGRRYLGDALDAVLAGEPAPIAETPPVGCTVKWLP